MREIKFRAWDGNKNTMHNNITISRLHLYDFDGDNITEQEPLKIMQYTGLKDKNGKEIYEGDIVNCKMLSAKGTHYIDEYIATVEYDICNPCMVLKQGNGNLEYDFVKCDLMKLEVIGNIYENPELLR